MAEKIFANQVPHWMGLGVGGFHLFRFRWLHRALCIFGEQKMWLAIGLYIPVVLCAPAAQTTPLQLVSITIIIWPWIGTFSPFAAASSLFFVHFILLFTYCSIVGSRVGSDEHIAASDCGFTLHRQLLLLLLLIFTFVGRHIVYRRHSTCALFERMTQLLFENEMILSARGS